MNKRGFSLLEILVVIVIIGLLAVFGHAEYLSYVQRAKISEALNILEQYQSIAMQERARNGSMDPYNILFSNSDQGGYVSGSAGSGSAEKNVNLKYVSNIVAFSGTSGSNTYLLLGAQLQDDGIFVTGADFVYVAAIETPAGLLTWQCGISASKGNTIDPTYLPQTCQESLP